MPPRRSPVKAPPSKRNGSGTPAPTAAPTSITPGDIDQAKEEALLQLTLGRAAHYYAVVVSGALLFDALLVLFFPPSLLPAFGKDFHSLYFLVFPLFGGFYLAAFALWVKWEEYQLWPWEGHFSWTIGAAAFDVLLVYLYLASLVGLGPTAGWRLLPWFYPLTLVGITLPLIGFAWTWSEWSQRKLIAIATAVFPVPLALVLYLPSLGPSKVSFAIALSLAAAAALYQTSGSFLHLIASGTRTHEREVITSSQNRLSQVAGQLRERDEALRFRESTLIGREADVENSEIALGRKLASLEEGRAHATALESEVQTRSLNVQKLQREFAVKLAETNARSRGLEDRETALGLREKDHAARLPQIAEREGLATKKEGELVARETEVTQKGREVERKTAEAAELDARLKSRQKEIERKTSELLQKESELATKGRGATAPGASAAVAHAVESPAREARLNRLKETLDAQNAALGKRAGELKTRDEELSRRAGEVDKRVEEAKIREAAIARKETQAGDRTRLAEAQVGRYEEILKTLEAKTRQVETKAAEIAQHEEEINRREKDLGGREKSIADRTSGLEKDRSELDRAVRDVSVRAKKVESLEDELKYRQQALGRGSEFEIPDVSIAFAAAGGGAPPGSGRRSLARDRKPAGVPSESQVVPTEEADTLAAPTRVKFTDRAPTGTPRLDDLLLGGIPPRGHIMLIGDAFVGKEVAVYAFLTEGLKNGEPAIVVTAARAPDEVAQKIGLVTPQFHEYEQLGMVRWIDASIPESAPTRRDATSARLVTKGPQDHSGILSSLVTIAKGFEDGGKAKRLRVAFLGLSASLAHADERLRLQFVQNLVGVLKSRNALALYALETGTLPESQVETVLSRMDGAIYFKTEGGKSYLSVQGVGDVETRDWVEYRATNRALVIGSFTLERIR